MIIEDMEFDHLPDSVPRELYECVQDVKKVAPVVHESDKVQMELVKNIMAEIDPVFFSDPVIFPLSAEVMAAFAQLSVATTTGLMPPDSHFQCILVHDGSMKYYQLSTIDETILATGNSGDILAYACKHQPAALETVIFTMRMNYMPPPAPLESTADLEQLLKFYRQQRAGSPGMDRASKLEELYHIDQDHVINKFNLDLLDVEPRSDVAIHLGSGNTISNSAISLRPFYRRVLCVDPRLVEGEDFHSVKYEDFTLPDGDIFSDVAYGDSVGMLAQPYAKLIDFLYPLSESRLVVVKIALARGYRACGYLLRKPRPHNLEAIVQLSPDGDPLDDIYDELLPTIIDANEQRNERVAKCLSSSDLKACAGDSMLLRKFVLCNRYAMPTPHVSFVRESRADHLLAAVGGKRISNRVNEFIKAFGDFYNGSKLGFHAPGCVIKLRTANVFELDPGFPNVRFSAATVYAAISRNKNFRVKKTHGGFAICERN